MIKHINKILLFKNEKVFYINKQMKDTDLIFQK